MSLGEEPDAPRSASYDGISEAVTYAFGDSASGIYGLARLGLAAGYASGLAIVFRGGAPIAVAAEAEVLKDPGSWDDVGVAGLRSTVSKPLAAWRLCFDGEVSFELTFEAASPTFELAADSAVAIGGGARGFDQLCRVRGEVDASPVDGLGQRSRSWGAPDWERMTLTRTVSAWFDADHAVSLVGVRPAGAPNHGGETLAAFHFDGDRRHEPVREAAIARLSTTYDADRRQRSAGLELYLGEEDEVARRLAGEAVAGTTLELGRLRLHCAFFRWRMEGRAGVGRYDVLELAGGEPSDG